MEKPIFPSKYMRITQGYNVGTHKNSYAIDNADKDGGISPIYAPFTGIIKKIYQNDANEVWLESSEKVEYPDGTIDYLTVMFAHNNDVSNLFVGKEIKQNDIFYKEGTKGNVTGNHCHIECGRGKFTGTGWHKNESGFWSINNGKKPEECLWIDETITILNSNNYNFKKIPTKPVEESSKDESKSDTKKDEENKEKDPIKKEDKQHKIIFTFQAPKTDLYGVYLKEKEELTITSQE